MRRCPTCQRTFDDNMKFCQADGTPLVTESDSSGADDPFKTNLNPPDDQFGDYDPMKTMLSAPPPVDLPPPSPFGGAPKDSGMNAPSFGDLGTPKFNDAPLPSQSAPQDNPSGGFGSPGNAPSGGFGGNAPQYKEPEPYTPGFGAQQNQGFGSSPNDWSAPPAPSGWGNQGLGQNTPFAAPPAVVGQNQNIVLPIVSLVAGICSLCCYVSPLTGLVAIITGYIGMNNANKNPEMYGGKGLAIAGLVTGGIFFLLGAIYWVLIILGVALGGLNP